MAYRVSLYFYNTPAECEIFTEALHEVFRERSYI
jgi:selenocysteine lyase/cysteine desulfurase